MPKKIISPLLPKEKDIQNSILAYLHTRQDCFIFPIRSVGTFYSKEKKFLKNRNPFYIVGISDILGIFSGIPLAIEVKRPGGKLSIHQKTFLTKFNEFGGIGFVAYSIEDVKANLHKALQSVDLRNISLNSYSLM